MSSLRFLALDADGPVACGPVERCCALGPDDLPQPGALRITAGEIELAAVDRPAAIALPWRVGDESFILQTCLLPPRTAPYNLAVELARHRIKLFIAKCEDWQMFDLVFEGGGEHPALRLFDEARQALSRAIVEPDPRMAASHALVSLARGLKATDRLAMAHADLLLRRRFAGRAAASTTLGVAIPPGRDGRALRDLVAENFDVLVLPLRWRDLEVKEGVYDFAGLDRWMEWSVAQKKPVVAGPLVDLSPGALPPWTLAWRRDFPALRDMLYDHMEKVVQRYRGVVGMWNLAAGVNVNDEVQLTEPQMVDLVRTARLLVRQHRRGARTMVEMVQPFGTFAGRNAGAMAPLPFIERLLHDGVVFDAVGIRLLLGGTSPGFEARDLMQVSNALDRLLHLSIPVIVSSLGVPAEGGAATTESQSRWVSRLFPMALSKPFVESVFWCQLFDHDGAQLPGAGLIDTEGRPRPALTRLIGMRRRLRKPLGDAVAVAEEDAAGGGA
ncbi:MAG: hypothetical protein KF817_10070 [Phycisphaeraceae bacterium]|nr:hypothetical protein [Phycisphaeraceae bacterium]